MSSFVTHKNITILNRVIPLLKEQMKETEVVFVLTVENKVLQQKMTREAIQSILNLGRLPVSQCPSIYYECDALFLPTLMECFSANYPEAMKMRKPILTSDLPFCTAVCKDAALYCDPLNPNDIAEKMISLVRNKSLQRFLVEKGEQRLSEFDSAEIRAEKYLNICKTISAIRVNH
jgi:glycosyltransferase involved in cell wall biosynthesis